MTLTDNTAVRVSLNVEGAGARVLVVRFVDWLCLACRNHDLAYREVRARYEQRSPGAVRVMTMARPWDADGSQNLPAEYVDAATGVELGRPW